MFYYRVTFIPHGGYDKEWTVWSAKNRDEVFTTFKRGDIFKVENISEEEFNDYNEEGL